MKKSKTFLVCAMLSGSVLFSSCIGSFGLWNSLKDWNQGVSNKFVNELIFLAFHIVPVYEIAYLADALVLNSIEFWSGSNPTASIGEVKTVQGENGEYLVKTNENGYTITKKGEDKSVAIGTNYNQVVKELRCHFSEKKAMALLYKLEKCTIDLVKLSREIVELSREMQAKWEQKAE